MTARPDGLRADYEPGRHDPWTGEDLPPEKRWAPELFAPVRGGEDGE